jgi:hypothetical protein
MEAIYSFALLALTSFFTIMNPIGTMPVFMSMTSELDQERRKRTARKAVIVAFFTVLFFAFTGQILFKFFGISVNSFRIVGGVIFFLIGQDMLHARLGAIKFSGTESEINAYVDDFNHSPGDSHDLRTWSHYQRDCPDGRRQLSSEKDSSRSFRGISTFSLLPYSRGICKNIQTAWRYR